MLKKMKKCTFLFIATKILDYMGFFFRYQWSYSKPSQQKNPHVQNAIFRVTATDFVTTIHDEKGRNFDPPKKSIFNFAELVAPR